MFMCFYVAVVCVLCVFVCAAGVCAALFLFLVFFVVFV